MLEGFQKPIRKRKGGGAVRRRGPKRAQSEEPSHKAAGLGDKMKSKREKRGRKKGDSLCDSQAAWRQVQ